MTDLVVELVPVESLTPDPENARKHSFRNVEAIKGSLRRFGQRRPLVCHGDVVIAGNGTLQAAKALGWTQVAVTRTPRDWSLEQARAYALADNRTGELAAWDADLLADQLVELDAQGWDVAELGFMPLTPPVDPGAEWTGMPDFEQDDRTPAFQVRVSFQTEQDANAFFELLGCRKVAKLWWPEGDGLVTEDSKRQFVSEAE